MKTDKGITLIALVVTIVILLILAGISISAISGENGLINQAKRGKDETEISQEKEIINISVMTTIYDDVIEKKELQENLNSNAGDGITEVIESGDSLVVKFVEKNRYYEIDKDGKTEGPKELIKDNNAGDISKGGTADGSEEKPFQINCIEDLVEFSKRSRNGENFNGQYIILNRTLDFQSIFSYNDYTTTRYEDLNTDGIIEDIKTELTKTDEGCIGFSPIANFDGNFDGKNNWIKNIYENSKMYEIGLFSQITSNAVLKNLKISGEIYSTNNWVAGIVGVFSEINDTGLR